MGLQRPAEHHFVRHRPPPLRDAEQWIELVDSSGKTFWLDSEMWTNPVPVRLPEELPPDFITAINATTAGAGRNCKEKPATLLFLQEGLFYELTPEGAGVEKGVLLAYISEIADALREAGCRYVEVIEGER